MADHIADLRSKITDLFQSRRGEALDLRYIPHAAEDVPVEARATAVSIFSTPHGAAFQQRIVDVLENAVLDEYGDLEEPLRLLAQYPVTPYTYPISGGVARGERPSVDKLRDLYHNRGYSATVNLCAETPGGDDHSIEKAELFGRVTTIYIPVLDNHVPELQQVIQLLDWLTDPTTQPTYIHCEAGKGRTGVMIACYRIAVMGWNGQDALTEAKNFGGSVPMQQAFIQDFGQLVEDRDPGLAPYPLLGYGTVPATPEELAATLEQAARAETGEVE